MEIQLTINGNQYSVRYAKLPEKFAPTVLCLVSYMPNELTENLVRIAVASLRRHTTAPHTLCVVDNASPEERLDWLRRQDGVVLLENRTKPEAGSYANAIGLEIARRMIPADTRYFMSLHQDIMVTQEGWLEYLLGKFSDHIRAVGVREDKTRVPQGILHVLGYIVDFQLVNSLRLDYLPRLPHYDVGDFLIDSLRKNGFGYFVSLQSFQNPKLLQYVPREFKKLVFEKHVVNFAFNDNYEIFFIHLGRGVVKTATDMDLYKDYLDAWFSVAREILGNDCPQLYDFNIVKKDKFISKYCYLPLRKMISYFQFKWFKERNKIDNQIDVFHVSSSNPQKEYFELQTSRTLTKLHDLNSLDFIRKRRRLETLRTHLQLDSIKTALVVGCRNATEIDLLEEFGVKKVYAIDLVSIDKRINVCDMHDISIIKDNSIDLIFSSHSLEHALYPEKVLHEFHRILINNGYIFIEVPIHFTPRGSDLHNFESCDAIESMLMHTWNGGVCLLKQEISSDESLMGTDVARILFKAQKYDK